MTLGRLDDTCNIVINISFCCNMAYRPPHAVYVQVRLGDGEPGPHLPQRGAGRQRGGSHGRAQLPTGPGNRAPAGSKHSHCPYLVFASCVMCFEDWRTKVRKFLLFLKSFNFVFLRNFNISTADFDEDVR